MKEELQAGDRAIHRLLCPSGTVLERQGQVTDRRNKDVLMFLPDGRGWDFDYPVLRENLRPAPETKRATIWLHRNADGTRVTAQIVHSAGEDPRRCPDCACFVESESGACP